MKEKLLVSQAAAKKNKNKSVLNIYFFCSSCLADQ